VPERIDASRAAFGVRDGADGHRPLLIVAVGRDVSTMPVPDRDDRRPVEDWLLDGAG
jgi:hypothetical protein